MQKNTFNIYNEHMEMKLHFAPLCFDGLQKLDEVENLFRMKNEDEARCQLQYYKMYPLYEKCYSMMIAIPAKWYGRNLTLDPRLHIHKKTEYRKINL